ncbi:hypothetical protein EV356DRAFT_66844 [Viridothelium virens]|uniref:Uncharacterized protein n=1 Tax=Viridothelium virens TaxID=1048519 RepID=A0A6A6HEG0_VIRVR|nr:hypothetical protein EV356DRAFT_66844 [Viridothelium virens]
MLSSSSARLRLTKTTKTLLFLPHGSARHRLACAPAAVAWICPPGPLVVHARLIVLHHACKRPPSREAAGPFYYLTSPSSRVEGTGGKPWYELAVSCACSYWDAMRLRKPLPCLHNVCIRPGYQLRLAGLAPPRLMRLRRMGCLAATHSRTMTERLATCWGGACLSPTTRLAIAKRCSGRWWLRRNPICLLGHRLIACHGVGRRRSND